MNRLMIFVLSLLTAPALFAAWVSPVVSSGPVKVGEWNSNFTASKTYAEQHHLPYIVYFGDTGCGYCEKLSASLATDEYFLAWQTRRPVVLCYIHPEGGWTEDQRLANHFVYGLKPDGTYEQGAKPGIAFYQMNRQGESMILRFTGRDGEMPIGKSDRSLARQLADSADRYFDSTFFPSDGVFKVGDLPAARLEIEFGRTTYVDVPVTRTNSFEVAMSNLVVATYGSSYSVERWATWAVGDETVSVTVPAPEGIQVDEAVTLRLFNEKGDLLDTSAITCVATPKNNPKNPLWIGAKSASELGWGEWTMDYDVARAKVSSTAESAFTLVLVGGSLWCPDCVKADHYLIDTTNFNAWAVSNRIACVAIDVPRMDSTEPSLLTYGTCAVSDRYVNSTEPKQERYQSGAGYLSRNMIAPLDAATISSRNRAFLYNDTQHGGLCRPENMGDNEETQGFKTGIPCLVLMRKDGSVAGRIYQFNNVSPSVFEQGYITRLDELLGQAADACEEDNDHYSTTQAAFKPGVEATATISPTDARDVWRLEACDGRATVVLTGPGPATNVTLRLSQKQGDKFVDLNTSTGSLGTGLVVTAPFAGGDVFVTVEAGNSFGADPKNVLPTDEESLVRSYSLLASVTVIPSETTATHVFDASVKTAAVEVVSGNSYWIEGLAPLKGGEGLSKEAENVYRATVTGLADVPLAEPVEGVRTLVCRTWTGGEIGFKATELTFEERKAGVVNVAVERTSGESGYVTAHVALRITPSVQKALDDGRILWEDADIRWENGDAATTNLPLVVVNDILHDEDLELLFDLTLKKAEIEGVAVRDGYGTMTVAIIEDDPEAPGTLAIAAADPAFASERTLKVEAGGTFSIGVARVDGATGNVTAYVALTDGTTELARSAELTWLDRSRENVQWADFTAPADKAGNVLTLKLVATGAAGADAERSRATLEVLGTEGPRFAEDSISVPVSCRFLFSRSVTVERTAGFDEVFVKKTSGALPPGVTVACADGLFTVSGSPSVAGSFAAAYQVCGRKGTAISLGGTIRLEFAISDMTERLKEEMPSLAKTRTYSNIPVTDGAHLSGLLTLTVPATGRASARYRTALASWSYGAAGWSGYEPGESVEADLVCTRTESEGGDLVLVVRSDGTAEVSFSDPSTGAPVTALLPAGEWSELDSAAAWKGQYTVQMPQTNAVLASELAHATGDAYLTLRMTDAAAARGTMLYSGQLPNGLAFSGSATLVPQADGRVRLPFMGNSKAAQVAYVLTGAVDIRPNAATEHTSYRWSVKAATNAVPRWALGDALGGEAEFAVFGGYYDKDEIWNCFASDYAIPGGFEPFGFTGNADGAFKASPRYGAVGAFWFVDAFVTEGNVPYLVGDAENPDCVKLSFKASTGVLSGTLNVPFENAAVKAQWRGIVLPGWGGCDECVVVPGAVTSRPFMSGSCWFADRADGRTFRNGCAVTMDRPAAE